MNLHESLEAMKTIQHRLLEFFDEEADTEYQFQNLQAIFDEFGIYAECHKLKLLLNILLKISNHHHRFPIFISKIEQILKHLKNQIQTNFTNIEIFNIFKSNKRILLFLIEEEMININEYIAKCMTRNKYVEMKYPHYFYPEIKQFINDEFISKYHINEKSINNENWIDEIKVEPDEQFYKRRKIGENEEYICELIRNDSIEEFVSYVTQVNYPLNSEIKTSIFETNSFLLKKEYFTLIEYAAFFGSIQIIKYLLNSNIELTSSLWLYAIHGKNSEFIYMLGENQIEPENNSYEEIMIESIKCHHNDISDFIQNNYFEDEDSTYVFVQCLKYYNFEFLQEQLIDIPYFYDMCKYDHYFFVKQFLETIEDINILEAEEKQTAIQNFTKVIYNEQTSLYVATKKGHMDIIQLLLTNEKLDINILNKTSLDYQHLYQFNQYQKEECEKTALYLAAEQGNIDIVRLLLTNEKLDVNILNTIKQNIRYGYSYNENSSEGGMKTALYIAVEQGNIDIAQLLLTNEKIDVNVLSKFYILSEQKREEGEKTALYSAVGNRNIEIIKQLLKNEKLDMNIRSKTSYYNGYNEFQEKAEWENEKTALYFAVENDDVDIIKLLLSKEKIDINILNKTFIYKHNICEHGEKSSFYAAIEKENIEIIKLFLMNESLDINIRSKISYRKTFESNDTIKNWDNEKTPLYLAVEKNNIDIIKLLLMNEKLDINAFNKTFYYGRYKKEIGEKVSFYTAVQNENIEIIKLFLMNEKLDINIQSKTTCYDKFDEIDYTKDWDNEKTPLYLAVEIDNIDIIKLLLMNEKLDINIINKTIFKDLISGYANYNNGIEEINEKTAFYFAVEKGNILIIELLLKNEKLNLNIINKTSKCKKFISNRVDTKEEKCIEEKGEKTPIYAAIESENIGIIELLLKNENLDLNVINKITYKYREHYNNGEYFDEIIDEEDDIQENTVFYLAHEKHNIEIYDLLKKYQQKYCNTEYEYENENEKKLIDYIEDDDNDQMLIF